MFTKVLGCRFALQTFVLLLKKKSLTGRQVFQIGHSVLLVILQQQQSYENNSSTNPQLSALAVYPDKTAYRS